MTTIEIAEKTGIPHNKIMEFYLLLEKNIVTNRNMIKCTFVFDPKIKNRYLSDLSESLILAIYSKFDKTHLLDNNLKNNK